MVAAEERASNKICDALEGFYAHCGGRFAEEHCYGNNVEGDAADFFDDASIYSDDDVRSPITALRSTNDDVSTLSRDGIEKDDDDDDNDDDDDDNNDDNDDNNNGATVGDNDSIAYMKPKKRSVEEMEALYIKAKSLLALRRYPAFVEALMDCQQLLSFQSTKHGDVTLLHLLSSQDVAPPEMYILQTISQDPSAVHRLDANGNSALHLSAKALNTSNLRAFLLFLKFCRGSAYHPNNSGDLPLHIAAATGSPGAEQAVTALVEVNPTALTLRGARGKVPLHLALAEGSGNTKILVEVLAAHKEKQISVVDLDDDGNTPLHSAIEYVASYDAIATFRDELKAEETFISPFLTKNRNGDLPLHSALQLLVVDPRIISLLLDAAPFAGTCEDGTGKMPVQLATAVDLPTNLVMDLLTIDMPIAIGNKGRSIAERQHGHSWWHVAIHSNDEGKFAGGISVLLEKGTLEELIWMARSVGPDGKTPTIAAASEELKAVFKEKLRFLGRYDVLTNHLPYLRNGVQTYSATAIDLEDGENASTTLRCYSTLTPFLDEINIRKQYTISPDFVEDMKASFKANQELVPGSAQVIAFQKPDSTLEELIETALPQRATLTWLTKCNSIIQDVASALQDLHNAGLVHGQLEPAALGYFSSGETRAWKLMELGHSAKIGSAMSRDSFSGFYRLAPPESIIDAEKRRLEAQKKGFLQNGDAAGDDDTLHARLGGIDENERAESDVPISANNISGLMKKETQGQEQVPMVSSTDISVSSLPSPRRSRLLPFKPRGRGSTWNDSCSIAASSIISTQEEEIKRLRQALIKKERELHKRTSMSPKNAREGKPFSFSSTPKSPTCTHTCTLGEAQDVAQRFVPESCLASPAWDAWALGVIMAQVFVLHSSVLPSAEAADELVMDRLSNFDAIDVQTIAGEVRCVAGNFAADLVGRLLDPNPETRLHSMSKVLRHRYFHEPVCEPMKPIEPSETDKKAKKASRFGNRAKGKFYMKSN